MFEKKPKFDLRDTKKIINFIEVREDMDSEEKTSELIAYGIDLLYHKSITDFPEEEQKNVIQDTLTAINKAIDKYFKQQKAKREDDYIYIELNNNVYKSHPINIKLFYYINERMVNGDNVFRIAEDVLKRIFNGILPMETLDEIKDNDYIYYEILIDDVSNLIYKTLTAAMKINNYKNPLEENKDKFTGSGKINEIIKEIDKKLDAYESDIYSIMLEGYNIMPNDVNKETAITILELLNSLKASQIRRDIKEEIDKISKSNDLSKETKIEALEQYLMELEGD